MEIMKRKRVIVSLSGGKNSVAMLLLLKEKLLLMDEVRYYDAEDWEFPHIRRVIDDLEEYIGQPITRLKSAKSFDWYFSRVPHENAGMTATGYGWPGWRRRWCMGVKVPCLEQGLTKYNAVWYIGLTTSELQRVRPKNQSGIIVKYPLIAHGMSDQDTLQYCYDRGFFFPVSDTVRHYDIFPHSGCWCCPFVSSTALHALYVHFPDLWGRLLAMDILSHNSHRRKGRSLETLGRMFGDGFIPPAPRPKAPDFRVI